MKAGSLRVVSRPLPAWTDPGIREGPLEDSKDAVFYVATLRRDQFEIARKHIRAFTEFESFNDWEDSRQWWQFGLSLAGVRALIVNVDVPLFARGCRGGPLNPPQAAIRHFLDTQKRSMDG